MFATVVADPLVVMNGLGPIMLGSGSWDLAPPASRFRVLLRPRLGLGTKGRSIHANHYCPGLFLFRAFRPSSPGSPLLGPIRSWALSSRRSASCATACDGGFHHHHATDSAGRREGVLQRLDEFDGLPVPAMFSRGPVYPYEVSHRPRNARRSLFTGQRSPVVMSGAICLELPRS